MHLNMQHRRTSKFFENLPESSRAHPRFLLRCLTPYGDLELRFTSRSELQNLVVNAFVKDSMVVPALGFNVTREAAAQRYKKWLARLLEDGYCGLLFQSYPFEIFDADGTVSLAGRPPVPVADFDAPLDRDAFGRDAAIAWMPEPTKGQRQRRLRFIKNLRDGRLYCPQLVEFRAVLLRSDLAEDVHAICQRL